MASRKQILDQLETDLKKIQTNNGYETDPVEIIHGFALFDDGIQTPVICFILTSDTKDQEHLDINRFRTISIYLYGWTDVSFRNYEPIYNLAQDVETFLMSTDWTYTDDTLLGDVIISPIGTDNNRCAFEVFVEIKYCQEL